MTCPAILLAFLAALPVIARDKWEPPEDRALRLEVAALAICQASRGNPQTAAAVAVQGARESLFAVGWGQCHCDGAECDHGRAHGYWQQHRRPVDTADDWWGLCSVSDPATLLAASRTAAYFRTCQGGDLGCLARGFASLGGLTGETSPDWATERAKATLELAAKIRASKKKRRLANKRSTTPNS